MIVGTANAITFSMKGFCYLLALLFLVGSILESNEGFFSIFGEKELEVPDVFLGFTCQRKLIPSFK